MREVTREYFIERVGREPENDDLERCNCDCGNVVGHMMCGWCEAHDKPRFICACMPNDVVLTKTGVFEVVRDPFTLERCNFKVDASEEPKPIPNFGVLPVTFSGTINCVWQEGVPQELLQYLEKQPEISDIFRNHMMEPRMYHAMVNQVQGVLMNLVSERKLYRGLEPQKWVFRP